MWVFDSSATSMVWKSVTMVPGLYKIFDEILVNAADNKIRDPKMDTLKVTVDKATNTISVYNNGRGIPIEIHSVCHLSGCPISSQGICTYNLIERESLCSGADLWPSSYFFQL